MSFPHRGAKELPRHAGSGRHPHREFSWTSCGNSGLDCSGPGRPKDIFIVCKTGCVPPRSGYRRLGQLQLYQYICRRVAFSPLWRAPSFNRRQSDLEKRQHPTEDPLRLHHRRAGRMGRISVERAAISGRCKAISCGAGRNRGRLRLTHREPSRPPSLADEGLPEPSWRIY